uniref:Uncharacterized protein n=1 Tax=Myoviridae sp. ctgXL3 TaxID=2826681 RepID=A0A8S5QRT2_9CAUD|nr:MAG TPA: hypothetical protein [Myoviridae sp. ctgXL3]
MCIKYIYINYASRPRTAGISKGQESSYCH